MVKPWIDCSLEQTLQLKNLVERFGINISNRNREFNSPVFYYKNYQLISYTLRDNLYSFIQTLYGNYYWSEPNNNANELAKTEHYILALLGTFSREIYEAIKSAFNLCDRSNTDRHDPRGVPERNNDIPKVAVTYLPKGITMFNESNNKCLNTDLTAAIQREIILENANDDSLTDYDKTISIKVFNETENHEIPFIHTYFNKKHPNIIRRVIYKTLYAYLKLPQVLETIPDEEDKALFNSILDNFFNKTENAYNIILETIPTYIMNKMKRQEDNLIKDFSKAKQTALNEVRYNALNNDFISAKRHYEDNMNRYPTLKNSYLQAKKALESYSEVEFTAIETLLTHIKNSPSTKEFYKNNSNTLLFCIEEPIIHSESEVWAKYLTNKNSDINYIINTFANSHFKTFNTTLDILRYAVQRLIKEIFIDQKIKIYTAALLGLRSDENTFQIRKYNLTDYEYMPHPHIGSDSLTCWNEAQRAINDKVLENDGEMAYLQLTYALQQMTASDSVVAKKLIQQMLNSAYMNTNCYLQKNKEKRESFNSIIKEFIKDETDKINAIIASES